MKNNPFINSLDLQQFEVGRVKLDPETSQGLEGKTIGSYTYNCVDDWMEITFTDGTKLHVSADSTGVLHIGAEGFDIG